MLILSLSIACFNDGEASYAELLTLLSRSTRSIVSGHGLLHSFSTALITLSMRCSASSIFALQCKETVKNYTLHVYKAAQHISRTPALLLCTTTRNKGAHRRAGSLATLPLSCRFSSPGADVHIWLLGTVDAALLVSPKSAIAVTSPSVAEITSYLAEVH